MKLINGKVFENGIFIEKEKLIDDGSSEIIDCKGKYIIPALTDIHTHGCAGYDFSSATPEEINIMREYYLKNGISTILATTVSLSDDDIKKAVNNIKDAMNTSNIGARIAGINLEGPYLSPKKCGAHDSSLLKEPDIDFINSLGDIIKIVNVAPEYKNADDFIKSFRGKTSIAHTDCDYNTAINAINNGADHITHIFNAMNGLHHRNPGVIGAFFDTDATAEMICDGIHINKSILRMMFKSYADRIAVISDSMGATGLCDGNYKLGNLDVTVKNSIATLSDGTLAGSAMNIFDMMRKLISFGIEPEKAISSVTSIPADSVNIEANDSDVLILNQDFSLDSVIFENKLVFKY